MASRCSASLPAVRLLGSLAGSYAILHEGLGSPAEAGGALLLLAAATAYLLGQRKQVAGRQPATLAGDTEASAPLLGGEEE